MNFKNYKLFCLAIIFGSLSLSMQAQIYVNASATGGMNNGTSWANAYTDLQTAIANATTGTDIWVAQGTYSPGATTTDAFLLDVPGVSIYGGFNGTETMLSQRDYMNNKTILSGDVNDNDVIDDFTTNRSDNNLHVMYVDDTITNSTILDGLYIEHGQTADVSGSGDDRRGGGILCYGSPIIRNCTFTQNYGYFASSLYPRGSAADNIIVDNCNFYNNNGRSGGAIYLVAGGTISNTIFNNNFAEYGGGVYSAGATTTFTNCTFSNTGTNGTRGAGIYGSTGINLDSCTFSNNNGIWGCAIYATDVTNVSNCTFENNAAENNGGGILVAFGSVTTVTNTDFVGNFAGRGGALYAQNDSSLLIVDNCYFFGNSAAGTSGGAIYSLAGPLIDISNSEFELNSSGFGAAISFNSGDGKAVKDRLSLTNCHFHGNIADDQGGAVNVSNVDSVFLTSCLIVDNTASNAGNGGGLSLNSSDTLPVYASIMNSTLANNIGIFASNLSTWEEDASMGDLTIEIQNTIMYDLLGTNYGIELGTPTVISNGGNHISDTSFQSVMVNTNDAINALPDFTNAANADYTLTATSPCVDAGVAMNAPTTDVNGDPRVGTPDKGAVEFPFISGVRNPVIEKNGFDIFPNPVKESLNFTLENDWSGDVQFTIINSLGQHLKSWTVAKNQDILNEQVDIQSLAAGNYILIAQFGNKQAKELIIKL